MKKFQDVLDDYWDAAYREGEERRIIDDGTAQEALSWLQAYNREAESAKARVAELEAENKALLMANRDCFDWFNALNSDHQKALKALDELARLGNGTAYGNSTGNEIAQRCLASLID